MLSILNLGCKKHDLNDSFIVNECNSVIPKDSGQQSVLREGRHAKLLQAAISLRFCKESGAMQPGDGVLLLDGGRDGSSAQLLSIKMANA